MPPTTLNSEEPLKARRVASKPGQAPPPPTGTAARPSGPSGALHTSGAGCADDWLGVVDLEARPGPAAAHRHRGQAPQASRRPPIGRGSVCCPARPTSPTGPRVPHS